MVEYRNLTLGGGGGISRGSFSKCLPPVVAAAGGPGHRVREGGPEAIQKIHEPIPNRSSYARAGYVFEWNGDVERALALARAAGNPGLDQEIKGRIPGLRQKSGAW